VVTGYAALSGGAEHAFRWTQATGMQDLGSIGGNSYGSGISTDGSIIVGQANNAGATAIYPFRWTQGTGLQTIDIPGGTFGRANAISGDGNVIVGSITVGSDISAFRWTQATGGQYLGSLGGTFSEANAVSPDGSVIVGDATLPNTTY